MSPHALAISAARRRRKARKKISLSSWIRLYDASQRRRIDFEQLAGLGGTSQDQGGASRQHADFTGKLARFMNRDVSLATVGGPDDLEPPF